MWGLLVYIVSMSDERREDIASRKRRVAAEAGQVQELLDRLAKGETIKDPSRFVREGAEAKLFRPENADEAGEVGEAVVTAVLKRMVGLREIDWYEKTERGDVDDLRGVDFFAQVNSEKYPQVGKVEIDATWNSEGIIRKKSQIEEYLRKKKSRMSVEEFLLSQKKIILAASNEDRPMDKLRSDLEVMSKYWMEKSAIPKPKGRR